MLPFADAVLVRAGTGQGALAPGEVRAVAEGAAAAGFDALFVSGDPDARPGDAEPFTVLGSLPEGCPLLLGAVVGLHGRAPSVLAKLAASLGLLQGRRVAVVLDAADSEPDAVLEAVSVMALLAGGPGPHRFEGRHFIVDGAYNEPRAPSPPYFGVLADDRLRALLTDPATTGAVDFVAVRSGTGPAGSPIAQVVVPGSGSGDERSRIVLGEGSDAPSVLASIGVGTEATRSPQRPGSSSSSAS